MNKREWLRIVSFILLYHIDAERKICFVNIRSSNLEISARFISLFITNFIIQQLKSYTHTAHTHMYIFVQRAFSWNRFDKIFHAIFVNLVVRGRGPTRKKSGSSSIAHHVKKSVASIQWLQSKNTFSVGFWKVCHTHNVKMYLWQFYHNEYLSISKQHLYLSAVQTDAHIAHTRWQKWIGKFARQMPNKKKMWLNSPHDSMFHAHTHCQSHIRHRLHISIQRTTVHIAQKYVSFIFSLSHIQSVNRCDFHTLQIHTRTHMRTPRITKRNKNYGRIANALHWMFLSFFLLVVVSCVYLYMKRDGEHVCFGFGLLWFTMSSVNATHNHIWIKIRVISTCCVYDILMINHPKLDGMLYVKCVGGGDAHNIALCDVWFSAATSVFS